MEGKEFSRHSFSCFFLALCLALPLLIGGQMSYAANASDDMSIGARCWTNADCTEGYFCSKPIAYCEGPGICVQKPDACITLYDPVCGCDGRTYGNACDAAHFGVSVNYPGECGQCDISCDVNFDGGCDIGDVILALRIALKLDPGQLPKCFDVNKDGDIDIADVILILRMALGLAE